MRGISNKKGRAEVCLNFKQSINVFPKNVKMPFPLKFALRIKKSVKPLIAPASSQVFLKVKGYF